VGGKKTEQVEETWMAGNVDMNVREVIREIRLAPGPEPQGAVCVPLVGSFASRCRLVQ